MKKTLIALAALAATGAAFAQSSVTLYGRLDAGYANSVRTQEVAGGATNEAKLLGVNSHNSVSSYWGITGTEDLGGGLKAGFKLEQDVFTANGNTGSSGANLGAASSGAFDRTSLVSLEGNFGTVAFGRDYVPTFSLIAANDIFGQTRLTTVGLAAGVGSSVDKQFMYTTPNFSGFVGKLSVGNTDGSSTGSDVTARNNNLSLSYANGPLNVGFGWGTQEAVGNGQAAIAATTFTTINGSTNAVAAGTTTKAELSALTAAYDFGSFKLLGNYITTKYNPNTANSLDTTRTEYNFGAVVPVGKVNLLAQIGRNTFSSNVAATTGDSSGTDWALGADYALSKRTTLYVKTGVVNKFDGTAAANSQSVNATTVNGNTKLTETNFGVRHTF
ncbi:MAG: hypothetical protein CK604_04675 [Curvibacter sp. PD_MW3]|nr:MAG: hypothetical protein CK604_04675 [Curvibacter sp. PD_MW3]